MKRKFRIYSYLYKNTKNILEDAIGLGEKLGITEEFKGTFALTPAHSSFPGPIANDIQKEIIRPELQSRPLPHLVDELRDTVKDYYGDDYDAASAGSGEGALLVAFESLITPPVLGRGSGYRAKYISLIERHVSYHSNFGRPYPPKYKYIASDRYITSGELGVEGKRLVDLDAVLVPSVGARYEPHGIKYYPAPLLSEVDSEFTAQRVNEYAERHASTLSGFATLAYDTPGYGYAEKSEDGTPKLQKLIGRIASKFDLPYVTDDAWGAPIIGTDVRKIDASVIVYSVDKVMRGPLSSLIIGKEDALVPIRKGLGVHSHRFGSPAAYSKAAYSAFDPGREQIIAQNFILKELQENPKKFTQSVDETFKLVTDEFKNYFEPEMFRKDILISKSYNNLAVEINYDQTWKNGQTGIPIFTEEDSFAGTALIETSLSAMGLLPTITYDGNIFISPGHGTVREDGSLHEERMRIGIRAIFGAIRIICEYAARV